MVDEMQVGEVEASQVNAALEQRVAGRDYFEFLVPGSIKLVLATWPKEKLDELALSNSRLFRYRFGFEPTRAARRDVLAIQNRYDLTDRQIRWLQNGGQLSVKATGAKLSPTRLGPISGWVQLAMLSLMCIAMEVTIAYSHAAAWRLALGQIFMSSIWFGGTWFLNAMYISPWRTLKNAGALPAIN